jgi:polyisoprenoid-binding protein YceI
MTARPLAAALLLVGALALSAAHADDAAPRFAIDPKAGEVRLEVKKKGALKAFAHDHDMVARVYTGTVVWSPADLEKASVEIRITTKEIEVLDPELSESDRNTVRDEMRGEKCLDVAKYPEISFVSQSVIAHEKDAQGHRPLSVVGKLTLHGVTKQRTLEVVLVEKDGALEVTGEHRLKQTDFGMEPISVALGTISVQDELVVKWKIVARRETSKKPDK